MNIRPIAAAILIAASAIGCRSPRVDITIENGTGSQINQVEVDYPKAAFGIDHLSAGAIYQYRVQTRGSGPIQIRYVESATHLQRQLTGPVLTENQSGEVRIRLLPAGKVISH